MTTNSGQKSVPSNLWGALYAKKLDPEEHPWNPEDE